MLSEKGKNKKWITFWPWKMGHWRKDKKREWGRGGNHPNHAKVAKWNAIIWKWIKRICPSLSLSLSLPQPWSPFHTALAFLGSCLEASYFFLAHHKVACNSHYPRLPQFLYQFLHLPICLPISLLFCLILFVLSFVFIILVTNENGGWAAAHLPSFFIIF